MSGAQAPQPRQRCSQRCKVERVGSPGRPSRSGAPSGGGARNGMGAGVPQTAQLGMRARVERLEGCRKRPHHPRALPFQRVINLRTGGCQCGAVRFSSIGTIGQLYVCHCRECQKQSASAFGMSLQVPRNGLKLLSGEPKAWGRNADSGNRVNCMFCSNCGSRLWHESEARPETVTIKAGCLDEPVDISTAIHIWTARKLPGTVIPRDASQFQGEPCD